jgi:hypothetical protein
MKVKSVSKAGGTSPTSTRRGSNVIAGGIGSKVVRPTGTRDGQKAFSVNPAAVAQLGGVYGSHITGRPGTDYRGEPWTKGPAPISVQLGNEVAKNVGGGGVGVGRTLHGQCGSQGTYGPTNPGQSRPGADKPILGAFGPDTSNARSRR